MGIAGAVIPQKLSAPPIRQMSGYARVVQSADRARTVLKNNTLAQAAGVFVCACECVSVCLYGVVVADVVLGVVVVAMTACGLWSVGFGSCTAM